MLERVPTTDFKAELHTCLSSARRTLLWKLDGLRDYDVRRPLTATGTNLLGLLKHLTCCEIGYFATTFDRPITDPPPWLQATEHHEQFWARTDETREQIRAAYTRAVQHSDATIEALPLDAAGEVPTWPPADRHVTLHRIMVHMTAETQRHLGHADILRETVDGSAGWTRDHLLLDDHDPDWWHQHRAHLERIAREAHR